MSTTTITTITVIDTGKGQATSSATLAATVLKGTFDTGSATEPVSVGLMDAAISRRASVAPYRVK